MPKHRTPKIFMKKILLITILLILTLGDALAQMAEKHKTYFFAEKDGHHLMMDEYLQKGDNKGTIIFIFGGGFKAGKRETRTYKRWFYQLNENGYRVYSIDYRLGLKNARKSGLGMVRDTRAAIALGVEDLFSATHYILENADELGVDPNKIIVAGSSAGAIIALHADWVICNDKKIATDILPAGFRYAAIMPFSGAILSCEGAPKYAKEPAPTCFFHGTADKVVNYGHIHLFKVGLFGGKYLANHFHKKGYNYSIYRYKGNGHEVATEFLTTLPEQLGFLETNVLKGQKRIVDAVVNDPQIQKGRSYKNRKALYKD